MSTINESLRKLEERGAIAQATLPPGVTSTAAKKPAHASNPKLMYSVLALAVLWGIWSEWDRRHPVQPAAVNAPMPVRVTAPAPDSKPAAPVEPKAQGATAAAKGAGAVVVAARAPVVATPQVAVPAAPVAAERSPADTASPTTAKSAEVVLPSPSRKAAAASPAKQLSPNQKADAQYQLALQWLQDGRGTDARQQLEEVLELNPAHNNARQLLAALRVEDRQLGRAEMLLNEGLAYHPAPSALVALARLKAERGEDGAALQLLGEHMDVGTTDAEYRALMAALLMRQGKPDQAIGHYRAAIDRQPAQGIWWAGLGLALASQKGRQGEAAQALQQARQSGKLPAALSDRVDSQLLALMRQEDKP